MLERWKKQSRHNKGVIIRTWGVILTMLLCGCFLDSQDFNVFFTIMVFGMIYLTIFTVVNRDRLM